MAPNTLSQITKPTTRTATTATKTLRAEGKPKTVCPPCETCGKTNHSTEKCYYGANAAKGPPPRHRRPGGQKMVPQNDNQTESHEINQAALLDSLSSKLLYFKFPRPLFLCLFGYMHF